MTGHRNHWEALLEELRSRQEAAAAMGGEERIARQHQRGRLTARERIEALADPDSFREYGALAGGQHPAGRPGVPADGLVAGTVRIDGRISVILAEDFTVQGGSIGHPNTAKRARLVRLALEQRYPLLVLLDGAGERASNQDERYPHAPGDLQLLADLQGRAPIVAVVLGTSAGHGALAAMFADLVIMAEGSSLFSAGPPLVKAAMGIDTTADELGAALIHTRDSGVAHQRCASEAECFSLARRFLQLLAEPDNAAAADADPAAAAPRPVDTLLDIIPPAVAQPYDMRRVLAELVDADSLLELQPDHGRTLIAALARIGGRSCMLIANQPAVEAGAITRQAADKACYFIELAHRFGLPLVSLVDNPGVMPGPAAERSGVLRAAANMFRAQRHYRGRKVVVTLRKAFGFGSSVMGMNPWDRQLLSLALPGVSLGGIPALGAAAATGADSHATDALVAQQSGAWAGADAMAFDRVIDPRELRNELIEALLR
ncbi:carboxyl transferase domain-containing protein [Haliea sp. E1-2-M8]|uniref:acyl-CoA carboxylase subunit beta n=1 Tax=Haliea sp. E1-2-M8 TaxID=3064706 RepID=UPI00271580F5|nr:carboxyl transferase domain-containing protein [Haliea sp. E1-2-M8]MDO8861225.1 carboxyl transferase domain-containing protein [Haliea sp. E1-2-M8]